MQGALEGQRGQREARGPQTPVRLDLEMEMGNIIISEQVKSATPVQLRRARKAEGKHTPTPLHLDQGNGKCQSDTGAM